ncbi:MAG: heme exporter protein CcmB [bacterium]|nr:heme exporter protein CcmB [bacterium]
MSELLLLLKKDFSIESRTKEVLVLILTMSLLLGTITAVGINSAFLSPGNLNLMFPTFLWLVFIFSSTLSISKSFEYEFRNDAIYGLLLSGTSSTKVYLSKLIANVVLSLIGQLVTFFVLVILANFTIPSILCELIIISALVALGFSAVSTILIPMSQTSKLKSMLLPLLLLPLLFPILFAGLELSAALFDSGKIDWGSSWISILLAFDVIYVALGVNLFEHVILD